MPRTHFDPTSLAAVDEPVQRYFAHAIDSGAALDGGVRLKMAGRIKVGLWMSFVAEQEVVAHAFSWRAHAGLGPFKPLHVVDRFRDGSGSTDGRLLNRLTFMHADDENVARAGAARAAVESIWLPASLLPERGVEWRAEDSNLIVANLDVPPERPELRLSIDDAGAVRRVQVMRWGDVGREDFGYIPFGAYINEERRFGDVVLPSKVSVGWWFGTPRFSPFFEATVLGAERLDQAEAGGP